jgi:hypothetical protein
MSLKRLSVCECGARWWGERACHCEGCHEVFTGVEAFENHRRGLANGRYCVFPDALGLTRDSRGWWGASHTAAIPLRPSCGPTGGATPLTSPYAQRAESLEASDAWRARDLGVESTGVLASPILRTGQLPAQMGDCAFTATSWAAETPAAEAGPRIRELA